MANLNSVGFKADGALFRDHMHQDKHDKTEMTTMHATVSNFKNGSLRVTNRALDVAVDGPGFFLIQTPNGTRYTRNGAFTIDREGQMVNEQGYLVLSADEQPIVFELEDNEPFITKDGGVMVGNALRGFVGVVEFAEPKLMRKLGNGLYEANQPIQEAASSTVSQGMLEDSNVNSIVSIAKLAQIEKEVAQTTNLINDNFTLQTNAFRVYSKVGG